MISNPFTLLKSFRLCVKRGVPLVIAEAAIMASGTLIPVNYLIFIVSILTFSTNSTRSKLDKKSEIIFNSWFESFGQESSSISEITENLGLFRFNS